MAETNLYVKKKSLKCCNGSYRFLFKNAELNIKDVDRIAVSRDCCALLQALE